MSRFELTALVLAPPETVFDLSLSVELHLGSMRGAREQAVAGVTSGHLVLGDTVTWRARHFGVPWRLTSVISAYVRPSFFVDEQVRGPFRHWHHAHTFEATQENGTEATLMTDVVDFSAPAELLVLRRYMTTLMLRRNAYLKQVAEAAAGPSSG